MAAPRQSRLGKTTWPKGRSVGPIASDSPAKTRAGLAKIRRSAVPRSAEQPKDAGPPMMAGRGKRVSRKTVGR